MYVPWYLFSSLTPSLQELLVLELGDQEIGSRVDSESAEVIARHCPRLQKLYMESCSWTDKEAILVGFCCPRLRFLKIADNNSYSYCVFDFNIIKTFPIIFMSLKSFSLIHLIFSIFLEFFAQSLQFYLCNLFNKYKYKFLCNLHICRKKKILCLKKRENKTTRFRPRA